MAVLVFDEERAQSAELLKGKDVVREHFRISLDEVPFKEAISS